MSATTARPARSMNTAATKINPITGQFFYGVDSQEVSMSHLYPKAVDKVEVITLQDNYIEMTAMDNNAIITRTAPLKDGEIRASILAEHGFSVLVKTTAAGSAHTLLFDFG